MSNLRRQANWPKGKRDQGKEERRDGGITEKHSVIQVTRSADNASQQARVMVLLKHPKLLPNMVPVLEGWLAYLQGESTRVFHHKYARRLFALEIQMRKGVDIGFPQWTVARDEEIAARFKAHVEAGRPEWMRNPQALPKAPPGRKAL